MTNPKKLVEMAWKWPAMGRRMRVPSARTNGVGASRPCGTSLASKGHFVVYTRDEHRFTIPIAYLKSCIFKELFKMSEEEFGFPGDRHVTLSCDAVFLEFVMALLRRRGPQYVERALVKTIADGRYSASASTPQGEINFQHPLMNCL